MIRPTSSRPASPDLAPDRKTRGPLAVLIAALLSCAALAFCATPGVSETSTNAPAQVGDARSYADRFGVSPQEAARRLELQRRVGPLEERLSREIPDLFAGLYLRHDPDFQIVVRLASPRPAAESREGASPRDLVAEMASAAGVDRALEVLPADVSLEELRSQQIRAARTVTEADSARPDTAIDVRRNLVVVSAPAQGQTGRADSAHGNLSRLAADPELRVDLTAKHGRILPASHGGTRISTRSGRVSCTKGFSVRNASGSRHGVTTAAHCPNRLFAGKRKLPARDQRLRGSADVQWHTTPGSPDQPRFLGGPGDLRRLKGRVPRANQPVGGWVCKYGSRTRKTCGTISGKWYAPGYVPDANDTFVGVSSRRPVVLPGDSGGPVFLGNRAYGTATAYSRSGSTYYGYYMPVDYLRSIGVRLKVSR